MNKRGFGNFFRWKKGTAQTCQSLWNICRSLTISRRHAVTSFAIGKNPLAAFLFHGEYVFTLYIIKQGYSCARFIVPTTSALAIEQEAVEGYSTETLA
jgi:hypothetical protein